MSDVLAAQRAYLAELLEAIQRSAFFLHRSSHRIDWPLQSQYLARHQKDIDLFETLAAINERFAKLQDALAATMRHSALLMGEEPDNFLGILTTFEKWGVLASVTQWQQGRVLRNKAAHEYDLDYETIAEHFNSLHTLTSMLIQTARRLIEYIQKHLAIEPASDSFKAEFEQLCDEYK